jgi:hypothetical protein
MATATAPTQNWTAFDAGGFWHVTDTAGTIFLIGKNPIDAKPATTEAAAIDAAQTIQNSMITRG